MPNPYDIQDQDSQFAGDNLSDPSDQMVSPAADGYSPASARNADITSGMRPETVEFLNKLADIGTGAFLAMRQADTPEYEDWRDENFISDGEGNYMSGGRAGIYGG